MENKIVLITGGNAGIGKATVAALSKMGATVIIMARNRGKGEKAVQEIQEMTKGKVELLVGDLGDFASIRQVATDFKAKYSQLDVLINNAGMLTDTFSLTKDGLEKQIGINHFGHFLLTMLLLDEIKAAPSGRIVNVSSAAHFRGTIDFDSFKKEVGNYAVMKAYSQSKFANVIFTKELAKRLINTSITVNALHPGVIKTKIASKHTNSWITYLWKFAKVFFASTENGARTSVFLASSPKVQGITGRYFDNLKEKTAKPYSEEVGERLWKISLEYTGIAD